MIKGLYHKGKVVLSAKEAESLRQKGYGVRKRDKLILRGYEAYYLATNGNIEVLDKSGGRIPALELFKKAQKLDKYLLAKYLIYRDLRERGYVVSEEIGRGIGFTVRGERGEDSVVFGICEGEPTSTAEMVRALTLARKRGKELVLAIVNRQGEVIYYSLSDLFVS